MVSQPNYKHSVISEGTAEQRSVLLWQRNGVFGVKLKYLIFFIINSLQTIDPHRMLSLIFAELLEPLQLINEYSPNLKLVHIFI